ncbi:MAG: ABC transporter ATP-binding protein [Simkania sp.]|nr:ABC transporter ATP-binding protein [Simkania sp.]MCP5490014.1 ABC transporter ATP-binding protein [Chlamydiales bacterium]
MKLLFKAALLVHRHFLMLIFTFATLIGLTLSNQMEMFTLGVLSDTGADFFALFASKNESGAQHDHVTWQEIEHKWKEMDPDQKGVVTKEEAESYLSEQQGHNPLKQVIFKIKKTFRVEKNLKAFVLLLCFVAAFKAFFLFFSRYTTKILSIRISRDLRQRYFEHIQHMPMSFYQKYNIGTLSSRVAGDASQIAESLNSFMINYIQAPFTILTTLGVCFYLSWQLSLVIFFGLPMIVIPVIFVTRKVKRITRQLQRNQERFTSVLIDFLAGIQTVKVFAMELFSFKKYKEQNDQMAKLETKTAKYDLLTRPVLHTITTICLATVIIVGLHLLHMKVSELVVFVGLLHLFYEPVKKFADENANIQKGVVAAERMFEVLDIHPQIQDSPDAMELKAFEKAIEFKNVWFRYEDKWILKDLSFTVKKGETVALVGGTGVGKSTIVQLIPRLYDIQKGEIEIDGKPVKSYTQKSLREQISFVPQKPFLFFDTIAANISYGRPFSKEEIIQASKRAHAHEFIKKLPQTYDTMLAETGKNFSGGQQQRLAIARALVKNAPILILDEATSSLDAVSENNIKMAIRELHGEITQILIAHRLSTIEYADRIIYLHEGEKLAEGTKEELLESCPEFRLMWETSFRSQKKLEPVLS